MLKTISRFSIKFNHLSCLLMQNSAAINLGHQEAKLTRKMCSCPLESIPKVDIDPAGVFKYILVKVYDQQKGDEEPSVTIVRGYKRCNYHSDIFDEVQEKLNPLDCEPLGGGRISHDPDTKKLHIYGYSQGYGKADHEIAAKLIKDAYPEYTITVSDEGY